MDILQTKSPSTIQDTRILFKIYNHANLPTVVFFAGIHGNEKAGVTALKQLRNTLDTSLIKGNVYGVLGNLKALVEDQRYIDEDLNRLWTKAKIEHILSKTAHNTEEKELLELFTLLQNILKHNNGPFYFIDLHTTSSKTLPFVTINDALINRGFSKLFPVPIVLGIEEYLEGALLSYINTLGYVSIGFESGQHTDYRSVENNMAFIQLVLVFSGVLNNTETNVNTHLKTLKLASENADRFFEIVHLQHITSNDNFKMKEGFKSFQPITKGTLVAHVNTSEIYSHYNGRIFMPLYQNKGNEGFFIIKPILPFFLFLSRIVRRIKADALLALLPGISWQDKKAGVLKANLRITKFLAKPIFHILGFRSSTTTKNEVLLYNRERVAKIKMYKGTSWFRKRS